ncbi:exported hypothetical protein [Paraburkholderia ribeironis]|uniref:Transmembrane protein n=1 Tax=Paraburkholderia ribeironis TaxID=1247936 RepID=A0A1N7SQL9_9BURK|nr:hypothetical protein [Paraburkholderia ribeironis]SIT49740.1 exported hypothetical protein [Paraburkholderia ribeironis]
MRQSNFRWKAILAMVFAAIAVCLGVLGSLDHYVGSGPSPGNAVNIAGNNNNIQINQSELKQRIEQLDRALKAKAEAERQKQRAQQHTPSPKTVFEAVDAALRAIPTGNTAFNTPPPVNIDGPPAKVELVVGVKQLPSELAKSITVPGEVQTHQVQIPNRIRALLAADDPGALTITPLTPPMQAVSGEAPTVWMWSIKPLKTGLYPLHVVLQTEVRIDGEVTPRLIDTFAGEIEVTITPGQRAEHFVRDYWQWLWTALLVPVGGWWWKRRDKKEDNRHDDDAA